jgi:CPA1 family monovalent cation:H+ antiporter
VLIGARRAQTELDTLLGAGLMSRHEHAERRAAFQRDIIDAERELRHLGRHSQVDVAVPAVLSARKAAILDASRRGLISTRTAGRHVAQLDEEILRFSAAEQDLIREGRHEDPS